MKRWLARIGHLRLALACLPALLTSRRQQALWHEMRVFARALPEALKQPLPEAMAPWTTPPPGAETSLDEAAIRRLADVVALLERRSPVGLCLRRSLLRYYFLRRAGLPMTIHYGARLIGSQPDRSITGHAWLTRAGQPYHEPGENWQGFTTMITFPQGNNDPLLVRVEPQGASWAPAGPSRGT
jgi:hypothetical protein